MQRRPVALVAFGLALLAFPTISIAKELMTPDVAARLGFVESWNRTVTAPMGTQSILDLKLHVHEADPNTYVEVVAPSLTASKGLTASKAVASDAPNTAKPDAGKSATEGEGGDQDSTPATDMRVLSRIWTNQADRLGQPIGLTEAERRANNEVRRLKRYGIEATKRTVTSPRVRLYSVANDGTLEARDAETGAVVWMTRVGNRNLTYGELGVDDSKLTVVNGTNLIVVDVANGEVMKELRLSRPSVFGAINSGDYVMVVGITGGVNAFLLNDLERDPFFLTVNGTAMAPPVKAPGASTKVAWATDQGFVYGMELDGKPSVQFRFPTDGLVAGKLAVASGDRFFFGTENGQVYGVRATRTGDILWSTPFGEPFYEEPVILNDQMFIRSAYGSLYCISTETGAPMWDEPTHSVDEIISAIDENLYVRSTSGALAAINRETGERTGLFRDVRPSRILHNTLTNRLYLVSDNGVVQCLRPESAELPTLNVQTDVKKAATDELETKDGDDEMESASGESDPFGAGASDPFGAGASDPFGAGDSDPFGGGDAMSDPFGGGDDADDPFGDPFGG